jgi:uncharacterized glyoxalase superfamily metalloenzyme YdcJ
MVLAETGRVIGSVLRKGGIMTTGDNEITEARLVALETMLQKLYAMFLSGIPAEDSIRLKQDIIATSEKWEMFPGTPPQDVEQMQRKMYAVAFCIRNFVNVLDEREKSVRERSGLPQAGLPDKQWS